MAKYTWTNQNGICSKCGKKGRICRIDDRKERPEIIPKYFTDGKVDDNLISKINKYLSMKYLSTEGEKCLRCSQKIVRKNSQIHTKIMIELSFAKYQVEGTTTLEKSLEAYDVLQYWKFRQKPRVNIKWIKNCKTD